MSEKQGGAIGEFEVTASNALSITLNMNEPR